MPDNLIFRRVSRWTLTIEDEERFVQVSPAEECPFGDLKISIGMDREEERTILPALNDADVIHLKRYDGCGTLEEHWKINIIRIYEAQLDKYYIETGPLWPVRYTFKLKWKGALLND